MTTTGFIILVPFLALLVAAVGVVLLKISEARLDASATQAKRPENATQKPRR